MRNKTKLKEGEYSKSTGSCDKIEQYQNEARASTAIFLICS